MRDERNGERRSTECSAVWSLYEYLRVSLRRTDYLMAARGDMLVHVPRRVPAMSLRVRRSARGTTVNSPAAVFALMLVIVFAGRNAATRFLSCISVTWRATRSVFNIGTLRSVTRAILGAVPVSCHAVPREMSPC